MDPSLLGPSTLAVSQGLTAFQSFVPKLSEIRRADLATNPDLAADVRLGEVAAVTLTMGVGAIASSFTKSNAPVLTAAFVCIIMVCIYESTLRGDRPFERKAATV